MTQKRLSPAASNTSIARLTRVKYLPARNATAALTKATVRYLQSRNVAGGGAPQENVRTIPPPSAVIIPRTTTPTRSNRSAFVAVSRAVDPNTNVPAKPRTTASVVDPITDIYGDTCVVPPSQTSAATTSASVPVSRVGWMTGAKFAEWLTGMSCATRPASSAFR